MYQKKKIWKRIMLMVMFALAFMPKMQSKAAEKIYGYLAFYDSNGTILNAFPAFAGITESTVYVYSVGDFSEGINNFAVVCYNTQGADQGEQKQYEVEYYGNFKGNNGEFSLWELQDYVIDDTFFIEDLPHINDEASIWYYQNTSDGVKLASETTILTGYKDGIVEASYYPQNPESIFFPGPVLDSEDNLIGILAEDGVILATGGDENTFYGEQPGGQTEGQPEGQPEEQPEEQTEEQTEGQPEEQPEEQMEEQTAAPITLPDPEPEPVNQVGIYIAVALACLFVMAVCIFIFVQRKKERRSRSLQGSSPISSDGSNGYVGPTRPVQEDKVFLIAAKDGYMKGRVYQMKEGEHSELTIGRNPEMTIRYPVDTTGISRIHARLFWQGKSLVLMDCNSTSGTFLMRTGKLVPMMPVVLEDGDVFYVGERKNTFEVIYRGN